MELDAPGGAWDRWLIGAIALGTAVRLFHVFRSDFPLNDGGLFVMMIEALRANHYVLPYSIPWAQFELPFAYPPLPFYVAAALSDLTGVSPIDLLRVLPVAASVGTLVAFAAFARALLIERVAVVASVVAFALMPQGFAWSISGGGLTRAPGQLFALLALHQLLLAFRNPTAARLVAASAFAGLTALSHPESALLLAASALLLTFFHGRSARGLRSAVLVGVGTVLVTAPWLGVALSRYGVETYVAAGGNSGGISALVAVLASPLRAIPGGPLIGPLALLGVVVTWQADRQLFLPAWVLAIGFLSRSFFAYSAAPIAMLAGIGAARVLVPGLDAAMVTRVAHAEAPGGARSVRWLVAMLVVLYSVGSSLQTGMPTLPRGERDAMAWIASNTPEGSAVLVLTTRKVGSTDDPTGDWFAALTGRLGLTPPQGTEWLGTYATVEAAYARLQECRTLDADCLERWAADEQVEFSYVYVPGALRDPVAEEPACCGKILASLRSDRGYRLAYDGDGASVFERVEGGRP